MKELSEYLSGTVAAFYRKHRVTDDKIASRHPSPDEWSLKEIIGHLINSASNNQQRFVGLQTVDEMAFPEYQKHHLEWIGLERFNELKFADLFLLWKQYNILMTHIIAHVDSTKLDNHLVFDNREVPLRFLIGDYIRHLRDHLVQFEETLKKVS